MTFTQALWQRFARWLVSSTARVNWLIARAKRTPYFELEGYMGRWWLVQPSWWLPFSIRVHHIQRADFDRNPHNHPWNFRTIVLRGTYTEELLMPDGSKSYMVAAKGQTYTRKVNEYHRVASVCRDGVWTLFIMGPKLCRWGFWVNGRSVYWREYLSDWEGV